MGAENTLYQDSSIQITRTRVIVGSKTYLVADLVSVSLSSLPGFPWVSCLFIAMGAAMCGLLPLVGGMAAMGKMEAYPNADMRASNNFLLVLAVLGFVCLAIGAVIPFIWKPRQAVMATTKSGQFTVLVSRKRDYAQTVVYAINDAILKSSRDSQYAGL